MSEAKPRPHNSRRTRSAEDSAELLSLVLQGGDLGLWDLDVATGNWTVSDREAQLLGHTQDSADAEIVDWKSLIHPEDLPALFCQIRRHLAGETTYCESIHRLRHRGGHYIWVLDRSVVVERDGDGKPVRMVGTHLDVTERKRSEELQRQAAERLELAVSGGGIGLWDCDLRTGATVYNDAWWAIFGVPDAERRSVDGLWRSIVHPDDYQAARLGLAAHVRGETALYEGTVRAKKHGGRDLWVTNRAKVVERAPDGTARRIVGITMDVTDSKTTEIALEEQRRGLRLITDSMPALIMHIDCDERYTFVNEHFSRVFDIDAHWLIGKTLREVNDPEVYATITPHVRLALQGTSTSFEGVGPARGRMIHFQSTYVPNVAPDGSVVGFFAMTYDITERKCAEDALIEKQRQLDALARHDALTGLPNRRTIEEHATNAIARSKRSKITMALMYLDIDRFKLINDRHGHGAGDEVLREFGKRLVACVRDTDCAARYAGDEFLMCLEGILCADDIVGIAGKIATTMAVPIVIGEGTVQITASIGIALHDGDDESFAQLAERADRALYEAKSAGRDGYRIATRPAAPTR